MRENRTSGLMSGKRETELPDSHRALLSTLLHNLLRSPIALNLLEKTSILMLDVALLQLALKITLFSNIFSTLCNLITVVYGISGLVPIRS